MLILGKSFLNRLILTTEKILLLDAQNSNFEEFIDFFFLIVFLITVEKWQANSGWFYCPYLMRLSIPILKNTC